MSVSGIFHILKLNDEKSENDNRLKVKQANKYEKYQVEK